MSDHAHIVMVNDHRDIVWHVYIVPPTYDFPSFAIIAVDSFMQ